MPDDRKDREHQFGGEWTTVKLKVLAHYLQSYTNALKKTPFHKFYIDAFAGTGYREARRDDDAEPSQRLLFPDLAEPEPQSLLDGSARIALQIEPHFDQYIFIENNAEHCTHLQNLKTEFPALASKVNIFQEDANEKVQDLCNNDWQSNRAVLFLDPYGMQVEWKTIEAIAKTKAIDLWLLYPLGIGVNRLLTKSGDIPQSWRRRLDLLLGTEDWYDEFYKIEATPTLFGNDTERVVKATMKTIAHDFSTRLQGVFAGVAEPGVLRNSANSPLYLLCFAVGNERGKDIALRIANHLLKEVR
ncbi:MAG: three-Cys-motif partner protein TcmP [Nitrospirales bacterium]